MQLLHPWQPPGQMDIQAHRRLPFLSRRFRQDCAVANGRHCLSGPFLRLVTFRLLQLYS